MSIELNLIFAVSKLGVIFGGTPCITPLSSVNPMFDRLLKSSLRDDSNKWSNIEFGDNITQEEPIEVHLMHLIW